MFNINTKRFVYFIFLVILFPFYTIYAQVNETQESLNTKINNTKENKIGHTAPLPKDIPEMAIRYFSGNGDNVCDMFMGSGTTAIVCEE